MSVTSCGLPALQTFRFRPGQAGQGVFVGTVLYCPTLPFNLLAYDMERPGWSWLAVAKPPGFDIHIYNCKLVNVRERLLFVALGQVLSKVGDMYLQVWELDLARMTWTMLPIKPDMPPMWWGSNVQNCPRLPFLSQGIRINYPNMMKVVARQAQVYIMFDLMVDTLAVDLRQTPAAWRWASHRIQ